MYALHETHYKPASKIFQQTPCAMPTRDIWILFYVNQILRIKHSLLALDRILIIVYTNQYFLLLYAVTPLYLPSTVLTFVNFYRVTVSRLFLSYSPYKSTYTDRALTKFNLSMLTHTHVHRMSVAHQLDDADSIEITIKVQKSCSAPHTAL